MQKFILSLLGLLFLFLPTLSIAVEVTQQQIDEAMANAAKLKEYQAKEAADAAKNAQYDAEFKQEREKQKAVEEKWLSYPESMRLLYRDIEDMRYLEVKDLESYKREYKLVDNKYKLSEPYSPQMVSMIDWVRKNYFNGDVETLPSEVPLPRTPLEQIIEDLSFTIYRRAQFLANLDPKTGPLYINKAVEDYKFLNRQLEYLNSIYDKNNASKKKLKLCSRYTFEKNSEGMYKKVPGKCIVKDYTEFLNQSKAQVADLDRNLPELVLNATIAEAKGFPEESKNEKDPKKENTQEINNHRKCAAALSNFLGAKGIYGLDQVFLDKKVLAEYKKNIQEPQVFSTKLDGCGNAVSVQIFNKFGKRRAYVNYDDFKDKSFTEWDLWPLRPPATPESINAFNLKKQPLKKTNNEEYNKILRDKSPTPVGNQQ